MYTGKWEYLWWVLQMKRMYNYANMNEYVYWLLLKYLLTTASYNEFYDALEIPNYRSTPAVKIAEDCIKRLPDDWRSAIQKIDSLGNGYVASEMFRSDAPFALDQLEHVHLIQNMGFGGYGLNPKWFGTVHWNEITEVNQSTEYREDGAYARICFSSVDSTGAGHTITLCLNPEDIVKKSR